MQNSQENKTLGRQWYWQDFISTYRYWALVLASFLMTITSIGVFGLAFRKLRESGGSSVGQSLHSFGVIGTGLAIFIILYFLRRNLKGALIMFALITAISLLLFYLLDFDNVLTPVVLFTLIRFGIMGFTISVIATLVSARPNLSSFLIAYSVILLWNLFAQFFGSALMGALLDLTDAWHWLGSIPAFLAALALVFMKKQIFSEAPTHEVAPSEPTNRSAVATVLLCMFVPFYLLYWISKSPAELKYLAKDLHQPSRGGAIALSLFAAFLLPIWFYDIRHELKDRLGNKSAGLMGFMMFFFPAFGVGMAQADQNIMLKQAGDRA